METAVQELINTIKAIAPAIWATYVKQVYVNAIQWLLLSIIALMSAQYMYNKTKQPVPSFVEVEDVGFWYGFLNFMVYALVTIAIVDLVKVFGGFYNPEYYAIQLIMEQVKP